MCTCNILVKTDYYWAENYTSETLIVCRSIVNTYLYLHTHTHTSLLIFEPDLFQFIQVLNFVGFWAILWGVKQCVFSLFLFSLYLEYLQQLAMTWHCSVKYLYPYIPLKKKKSWHKSLQKSVQLLYSAVWWEEVFSKIDMFRYVCLSKTSCWHLSSLTTSVFLCLGTPLSLYFQTRLAQRIFSTLKLLLSNPVVFWGAFCSLCGLLLKDGFQCLPSLSSTFGHIYTERATAFPSNSLRGKWEEISFLCKCVRIKNFSRSSHEFKPTKLYLLFKWILHSKKNRKHSVPKEVKPFKVIHFYPFGFYMQIALRQDF